MQLFEEYIYETKSKDLGGLTIFDIDDTLFHTTAKIAVMRVSKAYLAGLVDKEYLDLMAEKSKSITGYDILGSNE